MRPSAPATHGKYAHGKTGLNRLIHTVRYSRDGLLAAFRHEAAFRQLLVLHTVLMVWAMLLAISPMAKALLVGVSLLSLIVELLNSAIEAVVDRISLDHHPLSKNAKDMGSAAQSLALLMVTVVWALVLWG